MFIKLNQSNRQISYIQAYRPTKQFIAAQGPQELTIDDFWFMIWQANPSAIIMLTKVMESGRVSDWSII